MGKNKKHSKNKATSGAQSTQNQESSSSTKISEKKEAPASVGIHGKDEVSPEIKSLNTPKEDREVSGSTTGLDIIEKTVGQKKNPESEGNNKPSYNSRPKESRSFSPTKSSSNFSHKRWSEPMESRTEFHDKRKSIQNVTERERRQNYKRADSDRRIPRDRMRNDRKLTEFDTFEKEFKWDLRTIYVRTIEIEHDLFLMPKEYSLGHCVAEDMNMGSGIAVRFRHEFKRVGELLNQQARTGGLAVLKDNDRFVYYLVTKGLSSGKPTYETLFASLQKMREHIVENNVKKLALPRIGCGLDRLCWDNVKFMIEFIFSKIDIEIKICNLQIEDSPQLRHKNSKLTNVLYPIQDIEEGTIIIYLSSEDGFISDEMKMLDEKFFFLTEFRFAVKTKGNVIFFNKNENYLLCGCIVKQTETDSVDFMSLQKCLNTIQKENKKYQFGYIGFQAIKDNDCKCNSKIINVLRNSLRDVEVYVCWPGDLKNDMMARDRYSDYTPRTSLEQEKGRQSFNKYSSEQDSWRSPSKSTYNSKAYDSEREEQASTSILSDSDWFEKSDSKKSESNENNSISNLENTDWFMHDNNLADNNESGQTEYTKKDKLRLQTDRWDDSDPEDNETSSSDQLERNLGVSKTEENLWQSNVHPDEDSLEDNQSHSNKKPKKNKDLSTDEENIWFPKQPQAQQFKTDVSLNPDCKPYQPRQSRDVTVYEENSIDNQNNQVSWRKKDHFQTQKSEKVWANPDCEPFQPTRSQNTTVPKENPVKNIYEKDSWHAPNCEPFQPRRSQSTTVRKENPNYEKDSWHAPDCEPFQPTRSQNTTVRKENTVKNIYEKDSWHAPECEPFQPTRSQNITEREENPVKHKYDKDSWHAATSQSPQSTQNQNMKNTVFETCEYEKYEKEETIEIKTVLEKEAWDLPKKYSRVCYVTEDMSLESGIPFGSNFKQFIGELLSQNQKEGSVAVVKDGVDYLYCLVIKTSVTETPTDRTVFSAIEQMRNHALVHHVRNIVVPKMDEKNEKYFNWSKVKNMLEFLCGGNIQIFLAPFEHAEQKNRLLHLKSGLHQMKEKSIIIYWASEDGHLSHEMNSLCRKFKFFEEFNKSRKQLGNVIKYKHNDDYVLYGCIVRRVYTDPINFRALQQCLIEVNERKKTEMLDIVGIQAVKDEDETLNLKIINVLINTLQDVTLKVCWPGDLKQKIPKYK